jgi:hypothetical protein
MGSNYRLKGASGPVIDRSCPLGKRTLIGRADDCDLRLDHEGVAARHAEIAEHEGRLTLKRLDPGHDVVLNGQPVETATLSSGDEIRIASCRFVLQAPGLRPDKVGRTGRRAAQRATWSPARRQQAKRTQPGARVPGVPFEPGPGRTEPKGVAPGVHIPHHSFAPETRQFVRQQDLQVADRVLLVVVAARVRVQARAAGGIHADEMAGFVQDRVQRRVVPEQQRAPLQAGLLRAPERTRNGLPLGHAAKLQPVAPQQAPERLAQRWGGGGVAKDLGLRGVHGGKA